MRKIAWFVCMLLVVVIAGCGQQVPQVSTTSSQPKGLTIRGIVFGENLSGNKAQPLAGAVLFLAGDKTNKTTVSDADGQYSFTDLPSNNTSSGSGGYTIIATREGYQRTIIANLKFGSDSTAPVPDNSIMTKDISMINNPVVLDISPYPGATIEAGVNTIVVQFNEAMDVSSVRPSFDCYGMRLFSIADTQTLTTTWSADSKTLYVTTGALLPNKRFEFMVDTGDNAKDLAGNLLDTTGDGDGWGGGGLAEEIYNNSAGNLDYDYRTASGALYGSPSGLLATVNSNSNVDYSDAATGGNGVNLSWLAPASGEITSYRVYVSTSSSGPWALLGSTTANALASTVTAVNTALYGAMYNADCVRQLAFVTDTVYFKVVAYNAEGEGTGASIGKRDSVKPSVLNAPGAGAYRNPTNVDLGISTTVGAALTDYSAAGSNLNMGCYIRFTEPMNVSSLTDPTKYTLSAGTVTSATVVYNSGGITIVQLAFSGALAPGGTVTVSISGPVDLSGNVVNDVGNVNLATII